MKYEPSAFELAQLPPLQSFHNRESAADLQVPYHFQLGAIHYYPTGYSPDQRRFAGATVLEGTNPRIEWGYFSHDNLRLMQIDRREVVNDLLWQPRRAGEVERILGAENTGNRIRS